MENPPNISHLSSNGRSDGDSGGLWRRKLLVMGKGRNEERGKGETGKEDRGFGDFNFVFKMKSFWNVIKKYC